jgi:hypothetical protein
VKEKKANLNFMLAYTQEITLSKKVNFLRLSHEFRDCTVGDVDVWLSKFLDGHNSVNEKYHDIKIGLLVIDNELIIEIVLMLASIVKHHLNHHTT